MTIILFMDHSDYLLFLIFVSRRMIYDWKQIVWFLFKCTLVKMGVHWICCGAQVFVSLIFEGVGLVLPCFQ